MDRGESQPVNPVHIPMNETIWATGGSGLLALNWAIGLRDRHPVTLGLHQREVALAGASTPRSSLDTVDQVLRALDVIGPRLVVHTAALTNVDVCEAEPRLAQHINTELAANVASACAQRDLPLVHISSDHLFAGDEASVDETQPVAPKNVYGRTKAEAESRVLEAHPDALVVRTNFYGWGPSYRRSFSDFIIDSLRKGETITLFTDVFYTPLLLESLRETVLELLRLKASGIYHVVGDERLSKHDFGIKVAERFQLDPNLIRQGRISDQPALVDRPHDMSLSNEKARGLLGRPLGGVDEQLALLHEQERVGIAQELRNL